MASAVTNTGFADTDFFFFRVAESYLAYAEATARLNGGNATAQGIAYLNQLRQTCTCCCTSSFSLTISWTSVAANFISKHNARTDLIRYGYYGGNNSYNWTWKGGAANGRSFDSYRNLFPLPSSDLSVNKNLKQNPGY